MNNQDAGKLLLRLTIGVLLLLHGINKLVNGIGGIEEDIVAKGLPSFVAYGVLVGELVAPALVIAGFWTRIGGVVIAFNMVVAIWMAHTAQIGRLGRSGGWAIELPALFLFGGVCIALLGAGRYSVTRGVGRWN